MSWADVQLSAVALLAAGMTACSSEPRNYDDCILRYVKPGMDQGAVLVVTNSCREKFPAGLSSSDGQSTERELTPAELAALDGRAGLSFGTSYAGTLYNGNSEMTVTAVRIRVATTISGKKDSRGYQAKVTIPPRATTPFSFSIIVADDGAKYEWSVEGAKGFPSR